MNRSESIREAFDEDGPLASIVPGYEPRPGQVAVANAVEDAFCAGQVLVCEAGTGIGKSLAYLVPALLVDGPVVVSTATLALQSQFDLCLSDIRMPTMTGTELLRRLSATSPETMVMLMTAHGELDTAIGISRP